MKSRAEQLLAVAATRPLSASERAELDPQDAAGADPLLLAAALAGGAQRLSAQEMERVFKATLGKKTSALQVMVFKQGKLLATESFEPGDYTLGSDAGCEVVLPDDGIGACQAFLVFRDGKATLQNVGGTAAMLVNGTAQRTAEVRALDDVALGPFLLKFRVTTQLRAPAARAPAPAPAPQPAPIATRQPIAPLPASAQPTKIDRPVRPPPKPIARAGELPQDAVAEPEGKEPRGPSLRVRVFWGKSNVGVYGFPFGRKVSAGPADGRDVPLYRLPLPNDLFPLAHCDGTGWVARVPKALRAYRFDRDGWKPAEGTADGDSLRVKLEQGKLLRMGDAAYSVELSVDRIKRAPRAGLKDLVRSGAMLPFGLVGALGVMAALGIIFMPKYSRDSADFNPAQMLRAAKAILKPPDKKKEEKKKAEEKKPEEKKVEKKVEPSPVDQVVPANKAQNVNRALKAVQKIVTAGPAVESLLKATSKLAGGPKGYGDKGMGYKLSPLIGKPPIAMAGMGFGQGMGGFGTETHGLGAIRGMGGGGGGGIGSFSAGGTGKGKVAGTVVSAQASGFHQRAGGGTLARELIAKVINEHLGEVRGCYERALLKEAGLAGKLVLEWTIDTEGRVEEIKVKQATIKGAEVPNCIVGGLKGWVFPKPTGGKVIVSYPFLFNSVGF